MGNSPHIAVIGAGIGGLACALRLAAEGCAVTVLEKERSVGGKMRTVPSVAGLVDAGPTVMTMRPVFEELFAAAGERLDDHVTLHREALLARHFWPDGTQLDLFDDPERSAAAVRAFAGARSEQEFRAFSAAAARLFEAFDGPVMQAGRPSLLRLMARVLAAPALIRDMAPLTSLAGALDRRFSDPRLAQLFGRYATYVGGSPYLSPAVLQLIAHSEARGVWRIDGGMHRLAQAIERLCRARGVQFRLGTSVTRLEQRDGRVCAVHTGDGRLPCDAAVFNGDPAALAEGLLGNALRRAVPRSGMAPRSLSANVWAFAARPVAAPDLAHHNVFFCADPRREFAPLGEGQPARDATLYVCAQDRGMGRSAPLGPERFEIIMNAPPTQSRAPTEKEIDRCQTQTFRTLHSFGLSFDPPPGLQALTTPAQWGQLFPASQGALYGRSPQSMMATFLRPGARTAVRGLYLVGGGVHPGAGIPMATLSARHAAEAIAADQTSTLMSRQMATHGGTSTA